MAKGKHRGGNDPVEQPGSMARAENVHNLPDVQPDTSEARLQADIEIIDGRTYSDEKPPPLKPYNP